MSRHYGKYIILYLTAHGGASMWNHTQYGSASAARSAIREEATVGTRFLIVKVVDEVSVHPQLVTYAARDE
jgi:hypothetical protein